MKNFNKQAVKRMKTQLPNGMPVRAYAGVINATDDQIEITDGFYWAGVPNHLGLSGQYDKEALTKYLVADVNEPLTGRGDYPDTSRIMPGVADATPLLVNADSLRKILDVMTADSVTKTVTIHIPSDNLGALYLTHESGSRGLMPLATKEKK